MPLPPLTHHDILKLIEPFTRLGRELDLTASDRMARRLVFKPMVIDGDSALSPQLTDTLHVESLEDERFVLERVICHSSGLSASLRIQGCDASALLTDINAFNAHRLFRFGSAYAMVTSYQMTPTNQAQYAAHVGPNIVLTRGLVRLGGLTLAVKMPAVKGYAAELELTSDTLIELPDDLLAVLGRDWSCLSCTRGGWRGTLEVRGNEPSRSQNAANQLEAACMHLALTLAQAPAQFHQRLKFARWRVAGRRSVPVFFLAGLMGAAVAVPHLGIAQDSALWMLIFNSPPLLLVFGLWLREIPSFALPRPPKRLTAPSWWPDQQGVAGSAPTHGSSVGSTV